MADINEMLASIEAKIRARAARIATARALGLSVAVHAALFLLLIAALSQSRRPWARWFPPRGPDLPTQFAAMAGSQGVAGAELRACARDDSTSRELVDRVRRAAAGGEQLTSGVAELPHADSAQVWLVDADPLCRRAVATLNRAFGLPENRARSIYLVRAGNVYLAADTSLASGPFGRTVVMDSALSRVVGW
ncbi:MAG: hypothetical protein V4503_05290 [Gemmatimonadota bacterium]